MVLNYIWIALILISFLVGLVKFFFMGDGEIFIDMSQSLFDSSKNAFEFALGLTGALSLFLGILKIGEKSGIITLLAKAIAPFFSRIFPEVPKEHPVYGHILMNFSANILGLDNAATPLGLKAMQGLQELNPNKEKASNAQIMFLTLNASGLTIVPVSIMAARFKAGATNPADVFVPILLATFFSTIAGFIAVSIKQRINLFNKYILWYLGSAIALVSATLFYFASLSQEELKNTSSLIAAVILFSLIVGFILYGMIKKINVYEAFIEGAKEGFESAIRIIAYLIAIYVAITLFRTCGAMDWLMNSVKYFMTFLDTDLRFVDALPTALMKPLSGGGARGMMIDSMNTYGADSFAGRLSCIFQGAADTTFYIITVYFGYVGVKNTRYALATCLIADLVGVIAAIFIAYIFFG